MGVYVVGRLCTAKKIGGTGLPEPSTSLGLMVPVSVSEAVSTMWTRLSPLVAVKKMDPSGLKIPASGACEPDVADIAELADVAERSRLGGILAVGQEFGPVQGL